MNFTLLLGLELLDQFNVTVDFIGRDKITAGIINGNLAWSGKEATSTVCGNRVTSSVHERRTTQSTQTLLSP